MLRNRKYRISKVINLPIPNGIRDASFSDDFRKSYTPIVIGNTGREGEIHRVRIIHKVMNHADLGKIYVMFPLVPKQARDQFPTCIVLATIYPLVLGPTVIAFIQFAEELFCGVAGGSHRFKWI